MAHESLLKREETVLVLVDVQEKLLPAMYAPEAVERGCRILLEAAGLLGVPVLVTEQYPKGLGPTAAGLAAHLGSAPKFEKLTFSVAGCDSFLEALEALDREQVLLCGIEAHVCMLQSALDLLDDGYAVHVPADATASRRVENIGLACERMRAAGAIVTCVESALFELLGAAGSDEFKAVSRLVR